jgi:hypothetical protein
MLLCSVCVIALALSVVFLYRASFPNLEGGGGSLV